mmetsp:Transcript_13439/g.41520  ORF Transcript_13439/g.41520 Transcript_13439/m.41520 type:complete len:460 (+) Transcript_13439:294-1673(+)
MPPNGRGASKTSPLNSPDAAPRAAQPPSASTAISSQRPKRRARASGPSSSFKYPPSGAARRAAATSTRTATTRRRRVLRERLLGERRRRGRAAELAGQLRLRRQPGPGAGRVRPVVRLGNRRAARGRGRHRGARQVPRLGGLALRVAAFVEIGLHAQGAAAGARRDAPRGAAQGEAGERLSRKGHVPVPEVPRGLRGTLRRGGGRALHFSRRFVEGLGDVRRRVRRRDERRRGGAVGVRRLGLPRLRDAERRRRRVAARRGPPARRLLGEDARVDGRARRARRRRGELRGVLLRARGLESPRDRGLDGRVGPRAPVPRRLRPRRRRLGLRALRRRALRRRGFGRGPGPPRRGPLRRAPAATGRRSGGGGRRRPAGRPGAAIARIGDRRVPPEAVGRRRRLPERRLDAARGRDARASGSSLRRRGRERRVAGNYRRPREHGGPVSRRPQQRHLGVVKLEP